MWYFNTDPNNHVTNLGGVRIPHTMAGQAYDLPWLNSTGHLGSHRSVVQFGYDHCGTQYGLYGSNRDLYQNIIVTSFETWMHSYINLIHLPIGMYLGA